MKKKSSFLIIAVLLVLVGISVYVYISRSGLKALDDSEARDFAVKDTASITRIFIADKDGSKSTIERKKNGWVVNNKFNCRSDAILNLMEVIRNVEVKMPVVRPSRKNVIKLMSSKALKVEIYAGDKLIKQYYVGHETPDLEGSYMLLTDIGSGENFDEPFVCFIPGFKGYLKPRFIADENDWRDRIVISYIPPQIKQIALRYLDQPADSSLTIDVLNSTTFKLKNGNAREIAFDMNRMKQYLAYYQSVSYEVLFTGKNIELQDSLSQQKPFCVMSITSTDGSKKDLKYYRKQFTGEQDPEHGIMHTYDPDKFYLRFDNDKQWALSQYFAFGKLLVTPAYFLTQTSVKK